MTHTYLAYIDESGDDGLAKFRAPGIGGGSSRWLIITAAVIRATRTTDALHWRDEIRDRVKPKGKSRSIHFADFSHSQKKAACEILGRKEIRFISAAIRKDMLEVDRFNGKNRLYFYLTRHVIERLSWLCRDLRHRAREGDGRVEITFSRRGGMSYDDFRSYLHRLSEGNTSIHWPVIDVDGIKAQDHSRLAGLQLADCGARAVAEALEHDPYGGTEGAYISLLKARIYSKNENYFSYGLKILPSFEAAQLDPSQMMNLSPFLRSGQPPGP